MGIYQVKEEDVIRFAREHGKFRQRGEEIVLQNCPYCHAKDKDTFSINIRTGQFECKRGSCGAKGNMITLSRDFDFSLGRDADAYYQTVDYSRKKYNHFGKDKLESKDKAVRYMESRGISAEVTRKYELTIRKDNENVMVFPFRDETGEMVFVKYRNLKPQEGQSKEFCEKDCKPILFGMNHCTDGQLVITEGQIDSLSVAESEIPNAVSVPTGKNGFTWIPYCWDWMERFNKIVVFGDCENGVITLAEELKKRWPLKVYVVRPVDYKGCKDANEILQKWGKQAVIDAVNNAEPPNIDNIKPMASVKQVDIMQMEYFKTNMPTVDGMLDGGFRFGQLAVLTGKRGDGKSTLASMWGCEAMSQDYNCFFYSGELPDFFFRNWMDRQITKKAEVTESDADALNQYYGEKAFIYDNTTVEDESSNLLKTVEIAIVQKNCRFILIDNLMTAIETDEGSDLYRAQSRFVGELAALAKKYTVFILLVAHPRKQNGEMSNDDVSGSSNITDRADLVLCYGRIPEKKGEPAPGDDERRLEILKNRLTGRLAVKDKGIKLIFESKSKRIAENTAAFFSHCYKWKDDDLYEFDEVAAKDVPF